MSIKVPEQWPEEVVRRYEPVRILGKGGFASVVLAQRKQPEEGKPNLVAIKVVGSKDVTCQEFGYAHREIDVLVELNHPGVMKVIEHWEPPVKDHLCASIMILTYAKGPTLEQILRRGGALSMVFGRIVCAQLTDVLSYLHSHAVLHRDIKPDNIIITGAAYEQDELWDELMNESEVKDWATYRKKWHLTLVDFGFARALSPRDIVQDIAQAKSTTNINISSSNHRTSTNTNLDITYSRKFKRSMSAVGTRNYAAPEILQRVKQNSKLHVFRNPYDGGSVHLSDNLAEGVSSYGMLAEAYALGVVIRYAMTGVPPNISVEEAIASQNNPLACLFGCGGPKKSKDGKLLRKVQYRRLSELPNREVGRLIHELTQSDVEKRTSVRTARRYPWIDDVLDSEPPSEEIKYLSFTIKDVVANKKGALNHHNRPPIIAIEG